MDDRKLTLLLNNLVDNTANWREYGFYVGDSFIITKRWPEAESIIINDPSLIYEYAVHVINGRWPEAEKHIMKYPFWAYNYARNVIGDRWYDAENFINSDPRIIFLYPENVIKGRWYEAEPYLVTDPEWAYNYACNVINGPWPEAEPYIQKSEYNLAYILYIKKEKCEYAEKSIIRSNNLNRAIDYAVCILRQNWPEADHIIFKRFGKDLYIPAHYVRTTGRSAYAEKFLLKHKNPFDCLLYVDCLYHNPKEKK